MTRARPFEHRRRLRSGRSIIVNKGVKRAPRRELIKGGLGDGRANCAFDPVQLRKGIRVEMEHTNNPRVALEIAKDHLTEFSDYYKELEKMEKKLKTNKSKTPRKRFVYTEEEDPYDQKREADMIRESAQREYDEIAEEAMEEGRQAEIDKIKRHQEILNMGSDTRTYTFEDAFDDLVENNLGRFKK